MDLFIIYLSIYFMYLFIYLFYLFIYFHLILCFVACSKKSSRKVKILKMSRWYTFKGKKKSLKIFNKMLVYIVCHNPLLSFLKKR